MAPKRHIENPPPVESSEEEEEEGEEEEEVEEMEQSEENDVVDEDDNEAVDGEEEKTQAKNPALQTNSALDSGSDSDSEGSLPSPNISDFTIKPIRSKPMPEPAKPNKAASKAGSKRAADTQPSETEPKKKEKKTQNGAEEEDAKKGSGIQRLWSEDDEIAILKGITEYRSKTGTDPNADMVAFHEFIKKSLHVDVSKSQLHDKIRRLKKKFQVNAEKGEKNGQEPEFAKPHDFKCFQLSKKIWASSKESIDTAVKNNSNSVNGINKKAKYSNGGTNTNSKLSDEVNVPITLGLPSREASGKRQSQIMVSRKATEEEEKEDAKIKVDAEEPNGDLDDFWSRYPCFSESLNSEQFPMPDFSVKYLKDTMKEIGNEKAKEMEDKWRKLREEELKLYIKRIDLVKEQATLVVDAMKLDS